jgi:hypothetical protein
MSFSPTCYCSSPSHPNILLSTIVLIIRPDVLSNNSPEGHEENHDIFSRNPRRLGRSQNALPPHYRAETLQLDTLTFALQRQSFLPLAEDHFKTQYWLCVFKGTKFRVIFLFLIALGSRLLSVFIAALTSSCPLFPPYTS